MGSQENVTLSHRIEFVLFQLLKRIVVSLPLRSAQRLGAALGGGAYYVMSRRRRIANENVRFAYPDMSEEDRNAIAKGSFKNFGISFIELLWFPNITPEILNKFVRFDDGSFLEEINRSANGAILLTGHFGNWELSALATGKRLTKPMAVIIQTQNNRLVDAVINRHRSQFGNRIVPMGISVREILRTLDAKGVVALAADQSAAKESIHVEFFGRRVATYEGPAMFALRVGAPIIMEFTVRQPDFSYTIEHAVVPMDNLPAGKEEQILELTRRHTMMLERYIRKYPDQWLWLHRRWKHVEESTSGTNRE